MKKPQQNQSSKKFIILFGILSAIFSAILLYAGIDSLTLSENLAAAVLTLCIGVLFFLFSVLINRMGLNPPNWLKALRVTLVAEAAAEIIMIPVMGNVIRIGMVILCVLTTSVTAAMFLVNRNSRKKDEPRIPFGLAILSAAVGMLTLNIIIHLAVSGDQTNHFWIGLFFGILYMILSLYLAFQADPEKQHAQAALPVVTAALAMQCAALLFGLIRRVPGTVLIFQGCLLAALAIITITLSIRRQKPMPTGKKKKGK